MRRLLRRSLGLLWLGALVVGIALTLTHQGGGRRSTAPPRPASTPRPLSAPPTKFRVVSTAAALDAPVCGYACQGVGVGQAVSLVYRAAVIRSIPVTPWPYWLLVEDTGEWIKASGRAAVSAPPSTSYLLVRSS